MELRQLEHFLAIADEGGFSRAARRLHYGQSALSVSIQALERELGVRLFDRSTHRVALTDAGRLLLPSARRTVQSAEETRELAAAARGGLRGTLRIGLMQSFGFFDIPSVLGRFHHTHPEVDLQVRPATGGSAALVEELRQGSIDVAFVALSQPAPGVHAVPLASEDLLLTANAATMPKGRGPVRLRDLSDSSFVEFPVGWGVRAAVDRAFAAAGIERRVSIEVADVSTYLRLLEAGLGIGLLGPSLLGGAGGNLTSRITSPRVTWHVVMAVPATRPATAAAKALADLVTGSTGEDVPAGG